MKDKSRRDFLKTLSAAGGTVALEHLSGGALSALILSAQKVMANPAIDPEARFILFRIHGAMDSTLGLHPWLAPSEGIDQKDLFLSYSKEKPISSGSISLGPAAKSILPFADQMAIVRGVCVGPNDLGHPFALQHMTSGRTQESAPSWTSYVGSQFCGRESYVVTNAPLLRGALKSFPTLLTSVLRAQVADILKSSSSSNLSLFKSEDLRVSSYLDLIKQKEKLDKFKEAINSLKEQDQQAFDSAIASSNKDAELVAKIKMATDEDIAFASLFSGLAKVAQIDISEDDGGSLDNHAGFERLHLVSQSKRWERIARFLTKLKESNLLEKTLVVVVTEFNRTPGLNANGGKDHNYTDNAVALFGRGVRGGAVVGDRKLYMRQDGFPYAFWAGSFIDFGSNDSRGSGRVVDINKKVWMPTGDRISIPAGVDLIRPADVWSSVIHNLAPELISQLPDNSRIIPHLFKQS